MSRIKVKDLLEKTDAASDDDILIIEDSEDTKKIPLIKLKSSFSMDGILTSVKNSLLEKINTFSDALDDKYTDLQDQVSQLEVTCNNLENDHIHDTDRISLLNSKATAQANSIRNIDGENDNIRQSILSLETEKEELLVKKIELEQRVIIAETTLQSFTEEYTELYTKYNILKQENDQLKKSVNELVASTNETIVSFMSEKNQELSTKIEELMAYIKYYHPDVEDLEV